MSQPRPLRVAHKDGGWTPQALAETMLPAFKSALYPLDRSQDVFLKMMLTRHGGFGYGYILKHFVPRLQRHGVDPVELARVERVDAALIGHKKAFEWARRNK